MAFIRHRPPPALYLLMAWTLLSSLSLSEPASAAEQALAVRADEFQLVKRDSGPVNYYSVQKVGTSAHVRASYKPPYKTAVLGYQVPATHRDAARVSWSWRALQLPKEGDECKKGKQDSAAVVYLTWRRGLRWYTLKYVYSSVGRVGAVCGRKRSPFLAQDTIVLRSGGPIDTWHRESLDLKSEFRKHFEDEDPKAEVPDFIGIGLMSDGDQTQSSSGADYADFVVTK